MAHAGETGRAEHVRQAVLDLAMRRVEHGVRAAEGPEVLTLFAQRRICCDVALTSNECLKVVPSVAAHPLRRMMEAECRSPFPRMILLSFRPGRLREWQRARDEIGLSMTELWQLNLNGLRFGLADTGIRRRLMLELQLAAAKLDPVLAASPI